MSRPSHASHQLPEELGKILPWEPREFFRAARAGTLLLQRCDDCGAPLGPGAWVCDLCQGEDLTWVESAGSGVVYTAATVHQAYMGVLNGTVPYHIGIVELDEGLRVPALLLVDRSTDQVPIGARVRLDFAAAGARVIPVWRVEPSQ